MFAASIFGYSFMLYIRKVVGLRALFSVMVLILMATTISFTFAPTQVTKMVLHRVDPTKSGSVEKYSAGRLKIWRYCMKLFAEKPIFGHGQRTTAILMDKQFGLERVAHNQYLTYLVEFGIIGCALFILIFLRIFHIIWNYQKTTPDLLEEKLYIGYIAGLVGYNFSMLFININAPRPIFWFYTVVFLRYGQLKEIGEENNDKALAIMKKDTVM